MNNPNMNTYNTDDRELPSQTRRETGDARSPSRTPGISQDVHGAFTPPQPSSAASTPSRGDVRRSRPAGGAGENGSGLGQEFRLIWGTQVKTEECMEKFREFLVSDFFKTAADSDSDEPALARLLQNMRETNIFGVNIDCKQIYDFDKQLYTDLIAYPQEIIPLMDLVLSKAYVDYFENIESDAEKKVIKDDSQLIRARPYNLRRVRHMRDLNPTEIDTLVAIRGMVTRVSSIIPDIKTAFFTCGVCKDSTVEMLDRGRIEEPYACKNAQCNSKFAYQLVHNRCEFADKQIVKLQETPESIPEGETPMTVNLCAFDELVDNARPGDRIQVTGIYRAVPVRTKPNQRTLNSIYKTYIDVVHFQKVDKKKLDSGESQEPAPGDILAADEHDETGGFSEREERELREIASNPDIYNLLTRSLAPSIYKMDDVKKGILCQLFGGTSKALPRFMGKYRGEINILLVGDPGVSKSQLLSFVHKIAPRGVYTSGKGSSAVGLTAYVTRDPDSRELVLESGALVLSDRGVCCIDEFDKMSDNARSVLHEAMEQQTVSVAKAGIICSLNARTSVLAAANPVESRYNVQKSVLENIDLPPTLLSRFDLIYLLIDKVNDQEDAMLARHIVSMFSNKDYRDKKSLDGLIAIEKLKRYVAFARHRINPQITDSAAAKLVEGYRQLRQLGNSKHVISATPRQLESTIRIAEAHARIRYSEYVEDCDVDEALRLMRESTQRAAINPNTGLVDMNALATGVTLQDRQKLEQLKQAVHDFFADKDAAVDFMTIFDTIKNASSEPLKEKELLQALDAMALENTIRCSGRSNVKTMTVRRLGV
eukprot:tig00000144_g9157.t1